jgi:hypothetical protein
MLVRANGGRNGTGHGNGTRCRTRDGTKCRLNEVGKLKSLGAVRQGNSDNKGQAPEVDQVSEIGKVVTKSSSGIRVIK